MRSLIVRARYTCVALTSCALLAGLLSPVASAKSASSAPGLGTPTGNVVRVNTEQQLTAALKALASKTTVLIAPGVYRLLSPLTIGNVTDVVIRGESETASDVVIEGPGLLASDGAAISHAFVIRGQRITIANLTVREFPAAAIVFETGAASPRIYNVSSVDNKGTIESAASQQPVSAGTIEYSRFEYSTPAAAGSGAAAIAITGGSKWAVRHSLFKGLKGVDGSADPAILFRASVTSAVVESNTFVNCGREIVFGSLTRDTSDQTSGVIRNNFIVRDVSSSPAAAVTLAGSPRSLVLHNTILMNSSHPNAIELTFGGTVQARVQNNLLDAPVTLLNGATGTIAPNDTAAAAAYFVNPAEGDLHLLPAATSAIDAATAIGDVAVDWDGQARPAGTAVDYGADELSASGASATSSTSSGSPDGTSTASTTIGDTQATTLATTAAATATLPSPWQARDIGSPTVAGSSTYDSATSTFGVTGPGEGIYKRSDEFRFVYQPLTGDGEIVARIATLENTNQWAKAGVMIRQTLNADAANAMAFVSAKTGFNFQRRTTVGGWTTTTTGAMATVPQWVRLVRSGSKFSAYGSSNGTNWTLLGSDTISMSGTVYIGLAVSSQREGQLSTATFTNLAVKTSSALPSPWVSRDIGSPSATGSETYASGTFTVKGGGADIWGTSDQFHFVYQPLAGDGEVIARVGSLQNTDVWAKAGVMVRASLDANAANVFALASAGSGISFQQRASAGGSSTNLGLTSGAAPVWLRLVRKGSQLTASRSSDGTNWTAMGTTTVSMPTSVYVGLAVTSHNASMTTTGSFTNVAVNAGSTSNALPTVSITSPTSGQTFTAPATVTVNATAADTDGTISKVDFYLGSTLIGSDTTAPYSASTSSLAGGTYSLTAVAEDNAGGRRTSAAVSITVSGSTTTIPKTLTFTPSPDHSTLVTKYVFEVFTAGADPTKATPVKTQDLGKPSVSNNQITVDVATTIQALSSGSYFSTVSAVGSGGSNRSAPSNTFSR